MHAARQPRSWLIFDVRRSFATMYPIAAFLGLGLPEFIVIAVIILCILFIRRGDR